MNLVMTIQVRNEEDIIAANIDFHLAQGVDFFIVTNNLSVDGTRDILKRYERRGVLRYLWQAEDIHAQGEWVTQMARLAATEHGADWVINSDADEFWLPDEGDLKALLAAVPDTVEAVEAERTNFVPLRRPPPDEPFWSAMVIREARSLSVLGEPLPTKVCHRAFAEIVVGNGNHSVRVGERELEPVRLPLAILHFPMRSYRQFADKIVKGGGALARNPKLGPETGGTWRHLRGLWLKGELEAFYHDAAVDEAAIEAGLADGTYLRDERLKSLLARLAGTA
jgi:hypothetical protein